MNGRSARRRRAGVVVRGPILATVILLVVCSAESLAADRSWSNSAGGTFSTAANWTGGVVPGAGDRAILGVTGPGFPVFTLLYPVNFTGNATTAGLVVDDDVVTFDLNGFIYRTPGASNVIGNTANRLAGLTITDGFWDDNLSGQLQINPQATLTVSTGGSYFGEQIRVAGQGALVVNSGGQITSPLLTLGTLSLGSSTASASVAGVNSKLTLDQLSLGVTIAAELAIAAGGRVENHGAAILGVGTDIPATVTVAGTVAGTSSLWINQGTVEIGRNGVGALNISSGGVAQLGNTNIGAGAIDILAAAGSATVQGANSQMTTTSLGVGPLADGTLAVSAGALVKNTGAVLNVGANGNGVVNVTAGGRVEAVGATLGAVSGEGVVSVSGIGSQWINTSTLKVSEFGQGSLNISDGGLVQNANASVGVGPPVGAFAGSVTVDGVGSRWTNLGALTIGEERAGSLTVTGGAKVASGFGTVGFQHVDHGTSIGHGVGTATLSGAGSEWAISSTLTVGDFGTGVLNVSQDAIVRSSDGFVGFAATSDGAVHLDHAQWISTAGIRVGLGGPGLLTLANDASVQAQAVSVDRYGVLSGDGTISANLNNSGGVAPGAGAIGELHVGGAFTQQPGGVLAIDLGGTAGAHADLLDVGAATLDGVLKLRFIPGSIPATSVVLSATSLTGQFDNVASGQRLSAVNGGGSFVVFYGPGSPFNPNQVVLSSFLPSPFEGDFDHDGDVDGADLLVWQRGGSPFPNSVADLAAWKTNFGLGAATPAATAVPEPSSRLLFSFTLAVAAAAKTRRRSVSRSDARSVALTTARRLALSPETHFSRVRVATIAATDRLID
jgi:T5SS/PEP-CTERM-associated repeat protein